MGGEARNLGLQAGYLVCANNLRREAKLCDIILYVQGRMGAMVGYPAHKLLLISASKYFKLLFEREELRSYCHFPHLSEEGVFAVLDIIYGREIRKETNLDDALMAARFLQVDCAVEELERRKKEEAEAASRIDRPSSPKRKRSNSGSKSVKRHEVYSQDSSHSQPAEIRLFKNIRNVDDDESNAEDSSTVGQDSPYSNTEHSSNAFPDTHGLDTQGDDDQTVTVKIEPDVDLTSEDNDQVFYGQGMMTGQTFGDMDMDVKNEALSANENMFGAAGTMGSQATFVSPSSETPTLHHPNNGLNNTTTFHHPNNGPINRIPTFHHPNVGLNNGNTFHHPNIGLNNTTPTFHQPNVGLNNSNSIASQRHRVVEIVGEDNILEAQQVEKEHLFKASIGTWEYLVVKRIMIGIRKVYDLHQQPTTGKRNKRNHLTHSHHYKEAFSLLCSLFPCLVGANSEDLMKVEERFKRQIYRYNNDEKKRRLKLKTEHME